MPEASTLSWFVATFTDPALLLLTALGTFAGIYIGAIPGLSVTMASSILISFTFAWEVETALALIAGVFMGGVYGGSRTAILLNIPGAPSAIATAFDGYPLAKRGEAGLAIGVTTVASFLGGLVGIVALALAAPAIGEFALMVAPRDYFLLSLMGIVMVAALAGESLAKGMVACALGVVLGLVGLDPMTAEPRLTFGSMQLMGGISFIAAMIGLFGLSEVLVQLHDIHLPFVRQKVGRIVPGLREVVRHLPLTLRASLLGVGIGALPGTGGDVAALFAYQHARRSVKTPSRPFGEGAIEGLVAPEAANNAAVGGAYIPMLTLGIPGDAVTAVILGALFIHGLRPGPNLMIDSPHIFWLTVGNLTVANIFLLVFGLTGVRIFTRIVECPKAMLLPVIAVLCAVGTYAIQNSLTDVWWMVGFGVLGYVLRACGFQVGPVVLGIILAPLMDSNFRRALISVRGDDPLALALDFVSHPITLVLLLALAATLLGRAATARRLVARLVPGRQ